MTKIKFHKYEGTGNDFILIEDFEGKMPKSREFVVKMCDRHFGIGADGVLYLERGKKKEYFMRLLNSDGSEAEMCGNGIRCVAKHLYDFGYVKEKKFGIETATGVKNVEIKILNSKQKTGSDEVLSVVVNMGTPEFLGTAEIHGEHLHLVSMGNPHAVMFKERINIAEAGEKGPKIEKHERFPNRTNVEFAHVKSDSEIELIVYERGAGLTHACGTGACATVAAAAKENLVKTSKPVSIKLPGGVLKITLSDDFSKVMMDGPARRVFSGEIEYAG